MRRRFAHNRLFLLLAIMGPGLVSAAAGNDSGGNDGVSLPDENMSRLDQDVLVWNIGSTPAVRTEIEGLPIYRTVPAVRAGRSVFIDDPVVSGAWTWGTVLSIPTVVDALASSIARVMTR